MAFASRVLVFVAVLVIACTPLPARAGQPSEQLRARVEAALQVLQDAELRRASRASERRAALWKIAGEIFDFPEMTRRSLGRHWQSRTPGERAELTAAFAGLLERTYIGRIEQYSGEKIVWAGDTTDGDHATVRTRLVTKQGSEVPVDYRMHQVESRWRAYDVSIEGVSLIANYRGQFNRILQTTSPAELVQRLRARTHETAVPEGRNPPAR